MSNIKTPQEISAEIFERVMKAFNEEYDNHPINEKAEQVFLKAEASRQKYLEEIFNQVDFDMEKGTLIKIDLGPSDSSIRGQWELGINRPSELEEGEILLYTGWFSREVKVSTQSKKAMVSKPEDTEVFKRKDGSIGVQVSETKKAEIKKAEAEKEDNNEDLGTAFSSKIQVFLRGGREDVWTGLIPSCYYVTVAKGSGGPCKEPLFVQEHGLIFDPAIIGKVKEKSRDVSLPKLEEEPPALKQIMGETGMKTVAGEVKERHTKAEIEKLAKALKANY